MNTRHVIAAADPARRFPPEAFELDIDTVLHELAAQPAVVPVSISLRPGPPRRHRLDFALAALIAVVIAAVAFVPFALDRNTPAGPTSTTPTTSNSQLRAAANALLDEIKVPAGAKRVSVPPAGYLRKQWTGLGCKGTVSAHPRYWEIPGTTLQAVARYLEAHRPASASRLPFNHDTAGVIAGAFASYRPDSNRQVVIAVATTPTGVGIRADADVAPGSTCQPPGS